ncbi:pantothenate transporter liz1 [Fusarium langsethiae]|uniref:Pantothenate transporter liz1 n=1 Tax=Fusarium langsethiae TaxID=179993 RepID=A0A0M9EQI9_FUSLA|nr:pantothenate transporter liz1 [Fusarium langsethiae]GKU05962.1 unnamed protein product [Fusarium langsethiae]GKU11745.1 unnamed protein product [Fusarium langsethiae]
MPSTKTIAVAVAALAASGVGASNCKPSTTATTTASEVSATTSACSNYDLKNEAEIETEEINCGVRGAFKEGDTFTIPSWTTEECAKNCFDYEQFACELINFTPGEEVGIQGSCALYPDNEFTRMPRGGPAVYYDKRCFRCSPPSRGRGGRGGGVSRFRGRIRRS